MNEQLTIALPRISSDLKPQNTALIIVDYQRVSLRQITFSVADVATSEEIMAELTQG